MTLHIYFCNSSLSSSYRFVIVLYTCTVHQIVAAVVIKYTISYSLAQITTIQVINLIYIIKI